MVFRSVLFLRDFNEDKGSWAVASCATTGGGASLLYFDAAVWFSSASSSPFSIWPSLPPLRFRLLCFVDVGVLVLPEPPCAVVAVLLVLVRHRSHPHPTKEQPQRGVGVFIFVLHLRGLLQLPSFFRCGCTHGPLLLVVISQNRRGHNHGGGHGPISSSFSCLLNVPY